MPVMIMILAVPLIIPVAALTFFHCCVRNKKAFPVLVSSNCVVASAAVPRDAKDVFRDHLSIRRQFLIHFPDPPFALDHVRDRCAYSRHVHDCHLYDWGTFER